jgi:hypothetical protein
MVQASWRLRAGKRNINLRWVNGEVSCQKRKKKKAIFEYGGTSLLYILTPDRQHDGIEVTCHHKFQLFMDSAFRGAHWTHDVRPH